MPEQQVSLQDVRVLDKVDATIEAAIILWTLRPVPPQRLARANLTKSIEDLRRSITPEEFELFFPRSKAALDGLMKRIR